VIDARGFIWTGTAKAGTVVALNPKGRIAFTRRVGPFSSLVAVDDGVLVQGARGYIRLAARRSGPAPTFAELVAPTTATVSARPVRCVAPPPGSSQTCIFPLTTRLPLDITSPVPGEVVIGIRAADSALSRQGPYRVFAGRSRIWVDLTADRACAFGEGSTCFLPKGRYIVNVRLPVARGRTRVVSSPFRVLPSAGRQIY
jgi:hypothetical protein